MKYLPGDHTPSLIVLGGPKIESWAGGDKKEETRRRRKEETTCWGSQNLLAALEERDFLEFLVHNDILHTN